MNERELLFNGSGYKDETAYQAMKNTLRDERDHMGQKIDYQDGDIVEITKQNGLTEEALLLKCHEGYATAVILKERAPAENWMAVISRQKMYIDAGRPCYVYYDAIGQLIKGVGQSELGRIRRKVGNAIGLTFIDQEVVKEPNPVTSLDKDTIKELVEALAKETESLRNEMKEIAENAVEGTGMTIEKKIRLEAERDIFKALYEQERAV